MRRICLYWFLAVLLVPVSCMQDPYSPENDVAEPVVGYDQESLTRVAVTLTGDFEASAEIKEYGFEMAGNASGDGTAEVFANPPKDERGHFTCRVALTPGQVYNVRTYFTNGVARKYSKTMTLKAPATSVATLSDVSFANGRLTARVLDDGGTPVREVGFCWSESPDPGSIKRNRVPAVLEADNTFSLNLSLLEWGKVYHILAYAENAFQSSGDAFGYSLHSFELAVTDEMPVEIYDPAFARVLVAQFDTNRDGAVSYRELKAIETLSVNTDEIADIREISLMPALTALTCKGSASGTGRLTGLDLSGNPLLRQLNVSGNALTTLDVSPCPELETLNAASCPWLQIIYLSTDQWLRADQNYRKDAQTSFMLHPKAIVPIPDAHFRKYLVDIYDIDEDDQISGAESAAITRIDVCTDEIETLAGIEFLDHLSWLNCSGSSNGLLALGRLVELDVSHNPLTFLDCTANPCLSVIWLKTGQEIESINYDSSVSSIYYK